MLMDFQTLLNSAPGIGSFSSGLGSLISGLGFGGGSSNKARSRAMQDQYDLNRRLRIDGPSEIVAGAKKAGLHPLAVMGNLQGSSYSASVGGDNGFNPAEIGQGIDRALNAGRSGVQRKLDDLALEKAKAEIDYIKSQTVGSLAAITNTGATNVVPLNGQLDTINDYLKRIKPRLGHSDGVKPLFTVTTDEKGNPIRVYNEDAGDNEVLQAATSLGYSIPDYIHGNFGKPAGQYLGKKARNSWKSHPWNRKRKRYPQQYR